MTNLTDSDPKAIQNPSPVSPDQDQTILRAANGDVLRADKTGLVLRLSDRVIHDIADRLPQGSSANMSRPSHSPHIDPDVLGDIDAWDVRVDGEWHVFHARMPGPASARLFRRLIVPDDIEIDAGIIADCGGPLVGYVSLGGLRRATGHKVALQFPYHIVAPADDIGAVGMGGVEESEVLRCGMQIQELTRDAAVADASLQSRYEDFRQLPLHFVRAEHDGSSSIQELAKGTAYKNFLTNLQSLIALAERLNKTPVLGAIGLEYTLEDCQSTGDAWREGLYDLLLQISSDLKKLGLRRPSILAMFDCGTRFIHDHEILRAQCEFAWSGQNFGFHFSCPSYMFKCDSYGHLDTSALREVAEMELAALNALDQDQEWICPTVLLAERDPDPHVIRVKCRALAPLILDATDPFGAGAQFGFSFEGADAPVEILEVTLATDDKQDLLITCKSPPQGADLKLRYGFGQNPERARLDYPPICGALRDTWQQQSSTGRLLHRWALPAVVPVH